MAVIGRRVMSVPMDKLRKRVRFRSHHTGMQENDLLIGAFADRHLSAMTDQDVEWFETLLMNNNDIDLYNWMLGKKEVPTELKHPILHSLIAFAQNYSINK
jgi:antitoxin CptB